MPISDDADLVCIYLYLYMHICVYMYNVIHVCVCVCVCARARVCIYIYLPCFAHRSPRSSPPYRRIRRPSCLQRKVSACY